MANDQRMNMQMQVEDVKRAIAQETDPQKKAELAQHGAAYLEDLAKQNPEAYQSVLQANRRQGQAQQGQGGSILQPANPEDGLVDNIRQSRAKSSGMTEQQFMEYRKKVDAAKAQQTQYPQQEVAVPIDPAMLRDQIEAMRRIGSEDERAKQVALLNNPTSEREPVVQQGIFDRIGSGLKSVGRGMGQYTEKLFNDPNRMAMLQGGLSMMNPNSYYDKQGFGSVFQGLETGLGQAQKGMKGVLDRRKAISDQALVDAKAKQERLGVGKEGVFPSMLTEFLNPNTAPERKKWLERRMKELAPGEGGSSKANQYIQKEMAKWMYGSDGLEKASGTQSSLKNFINILDSTIDSDDGIITGPMTDGKLWIGRFLSENLGAEFGDDSLENTQRYIANMGTMVGEIIKQFGSGTGLSDADREFARMISAQDPSQFTKGSLKGVLALNEMRMRADLLEYNDQIAEIKKMSEGTIPSHLTKKMPRMSKNLRDHIKMRVAEGTYGGINDDGVFEQKKPVGWVDKTKGEWESMMRRAPKTKGGSSGFKIKSVRPKQ